MSENEIKSAEADAQADDQVIQTDGDDSESVSEVESEARSMGWKPESEWKGPPPKGGFRSADEFVQRGREIVPIVQAKNRELQDKYDKAVDEIERIKRDSTERFGRLERMSKAALSEQRRHLEEKYENLKEAAVEVGDKAAYREADKGMREALKEFDDSVADKDADKAKSDGIDLPASMRKVVDEWVADNEAWFGDEEMRAVAISRHGKLLKEKPGMSLKENLDDVRAYVAKRYPEKFGAEDPGGDDDDDAPPRRVSRVESGARVNGSNGKGAWAKVPAEDRKMAENAGHIEWFLKSGETMEKHGLQARERWAQKYLEMQ